MISRLYPIINSSPIDLRDKRFGHVIIITAQADNEVNVDEDDVEDEDVADMPGVEQAPELGYYMTPTLSLHESAAGVALRSLNSEAIWTLSSARPGSGIEDLLSDDVREDNINMRIPKEISRR